MPCAPPGGHVHATEAKISRFSEGTNNAFAVRKSEAANVSVGSPADVTTAKVHVCSYPQKPTSVGIGTSDLCRLCCKSLKTPGDKFPARSRNKPRSLIDVASGSLPKSPVSLSAGDEVPPHVYSKAASTARNICDERCKKTFATQSARNGIMHRSRRPIIHDLVGAVRPSDLAVLRLITSSNSGPLNVRTRRRASRRRAGNRPSVPKPRNGLRRPRRR